MNAKRGRQDIPGNVVHKALNHPLRAFIIGYLLDHRTCSATEVANVVGEEVGKTSYHLRWLRDHEFVRIVQERPVRGAIEFRYALASDNPLGVTVLTRKLRRGPTGERVRLLGEELRVARERLDLSASDVARALLVPDQVVLGIEAARISPPLHLLVELASSVHLDLLLVPADVGRFGAGLS